MQRVLVRVDNRLRLTGLTESATEKLHERFRHRNPQYDKLRAMGYWPSKDEPPWIETWRDKAGELTLPRGGMESVREVLRAEGLEWKVVDERTAGFDTLTNRIPAHKVELWEHQERIVEACMKQQNCLVRASTGSGKTTAALALVARLQLPTLVILWESGLMRQWSERLERELGMSGYAVGVVQGPTFRLRPVTLAMQQTLWKLDAHGTHGTQLWERLTGAFGVVIMDEASRAAARSYLDVVDRFPAKYRIGLSANETRRDGKEFLSYDMFGRVAIEVDAPQMVERGIIHEVEVRMVPTNHRADWYLNQQAAARSGRFKAPDHARLLREMAVDDERNALAVKLAVDEAREGRCVVMFSHRRDHCVRLNSMLVEHGERGGLLVGGPENAAEFVEVVGRIGRGEQRVAVGTVAAVGLGHDWPRVSRGVVTTPIGSRQLFEQARGRICRTGEGKTDAALYVLWDEHIHGLSMVRKLMRWCPRVVVRDGAAWVEAKDFVKKVRR